MPYRVLVVLAAAALLVGPFQPSRARPALPPAARGRAAIPLIEYLGQQARKSTGFRYTIEDVLPPRGGKYSGIEVDVVPPPPGATPRRAARLLQAQMPNARVWVDPASPNVVHFADRRLLAWRGYPLDKKLTFSGMMTIAHVEGVVIPRLVPGVRFYNMLARGSAVPIPYTPSGRQLQTPIRFHVKQTTMRAFLTRGLAYHHVYSGELWEASATEAPHGRFKRSVDIVIIAVPEIPPPTPRPTRQGAK